MTTLRLFAVLALLAFPRLSGASDLAILPASITLDDPRCSQPVLVERLEQSTPSGDLTAQARFRVEPPGIAAVSPEGVVTPLATGSARLIAQVEGSSASIPIQVALPSEAPAWSFRNHVLPVLTRAGCNSGACHGAAAGKGGLKLTLRGYAPELDHDVLTRQARGRRIDRLEPARSLVLLKTSGALDHGGGLKLWPDSPDYRVLAEWIAAGAPGPCDDDPRYVAIEALPTNARLRPGQSQRVIVQATLSSGRKLDVTRWARFDTTDAAVAVVDERGKIAVQGPGQAAITVGFAGQVALIRLAVPYPDPVPAEVFASSPRHNRIDELNLATLQALGIPPSPPADDATFLRRAYLDATGTLPPVAVVKAFLADADPDRRAKLVDRLLASTEFVDAWTYRLCDILLVSTAKLPAPAMWSFYRYVRQAVEQNLPWDRFAREILTATGSTLDNGAASYFVLHRDPIDLTENVSISFLGLSLTCARCHNHPLEKWTQDQYYGMANLFSRVQLKDGASAEEVLVAPAASGELLHPRRGIPMPPQPLDGQAQPLDSPGDRRLAFADWLTDPANPYFDRAIVTRAWKQFFGRGLIDPEDDLRATNPPSDQALLDWLVADFRAHGRDLKHLIRTIMTSAAYARSGDPVPGQPASPRLLSHYLPRRLPAEVLLDALSAVTESPTAFPGYPAGWHALQLPDVKVASTFLDAFGRPRRENTCSCERSDEPSMTQALQLANGSVLDDKLRADNGAVARLAASDLPDAAVLEHLYLAALSRPPTEAERTRLLPELATPTDAADPKQARRQAIEDLFWAVLTSKEFLFQH